MVLTIFNDDRKFCFYFFQLSFVKKTSNQFKDDCTMPTKNKCLTQLWSIFTKFQKIFLYELHLIIFFQCSLNKKQGLNYCYNWLNIDNTKCLLTLVFLKRDGKKKMTVFGMGLGKAIFTFL